MRTLALVALTLAALGGSSAVIYGQSAQAASTAARDLAAPSMFNLLPQPARSSIAQHSNHYRHFMGHNAQASRAGVKLMMIHAVGDPMCDDCGGNHPNLYAECDKCQNGALAACWGPTTYGTGLVSCRCTCGYNNRCLWIRW